MKVGYSPDIILAGRQLNDDMGNYVVNQIKLLMNKKHIKLVGANVLILGLTFKENCPDLRNTGVINVIDGLEEHNCNVEVYDPWVNKIEANNEYGITPLRRPSKGKYDVIVLAVAHDEFKKLTIEQIHAFGKESHILYDIKYLLGAHQVDGRL